LIPLLTHLAGIFMSLKLNLRKIDIKMVERTAVKAEKRDHAQRKYERKKIFK